MLVRLTFLLLFSLALKLFALTSFELPNGLEVLIEPRAGTGLATILLAVRTGAIHETAETNGLAHLYEHMFFKGNRDYPNQEAFSQRMRELGIVHNGSTSNEVVRYFFTLPQEKLEEGFAFMASALFHPLFNKEELEKERLVVLGEYDRFESDPEFYLWREVEKKMFSRYFYRKNPIGKRKIIKNATRKEMLFFKNHYYLPNNSALVVTGDVKEQRVQELAEKYFGKWEKKKLDSMKALPPHPPLEKKQAVVVEKDVQFALMALLFRGPDVKKHEKDTLVADLLSTLLSLPSGRWHKNLIESGLFSSLSFSYYTQNDAGEIWLEGQTTPGKLQRALEALQQQLSQLALSGYFTEDELNRAKFQVAINWEKEKESQAGLANSIGFWWAVSGTEYYKAYLPRIRAISLSEVQEFVQKYIYNKPFVAGTLLPKSSPIEKTIRRELQQLEFTFPKKIEKFSFQGIPVILKPMPTPTAHIRLVFPGGSLHLNQRNQGIERLLFSVMTKGSKKYPKQRLLTQLEEWGARLSYDNTYDASSLALTAPATTLYKALPLFLDVIENPLLDEEEVKIEKEKILQGLKRKEADPDEKVWRLANELFFEGHPYQFRPDGAIEAVKSLKRSQLVKHYQKLLSESQPFMVITGPLLKERLQEAISFRKLKYRGNDKLTLRPIPRRKKERVRFLKRDIPTYYIVGKFPLPGLSSKAFASAKLFMSLISEKMEEEIRTKKAFSYAAFAGISSYRANWGYVYVTTTKPEPVMGIIRRIMESCQTELFPKAWVQGVKGMLRTQWLMRTESVEGMANALAQAVLEGIKPEKANHWLEVLDRLTPEEIRHACKQYLSPLQIGIIGKKKPEID